MAHKDRPNDSHLRSRCCLIAEFDTSGSFGAATQYAAVSLPPGPGLVRLAYEVVGTGGGNVSFEVSGRPSGATNYFEELDGNTIAAGMFVDADVNKWEEWKVVYSAKSGTLSSSTLKVWVIT